MASLAHKHKLTEEFRIWLQYRWKRIPLKTKKKKREIKIIRYNKPIRKLWEIE